MKHILLLTLLLSPCAWGQDSIRYFGGGDGLRMQTERERKQGELREAKERLIWTQSEVVNLTQWLERDSAEQLPRVFRAFSDSLIDTWARKAVAHWDSYTEECETDTVDGMSLLHKRWATIYSPSGEPIRNVSIGRIPTFFPGFIEYLRKKR